MQGPAGVNLTPIDPQAAYDPEMAASLAAMRQHEQDLLQGTGKVMDIKLQQEQDVGEAQIAQMRAAAAAQGIPFNEAEARAKLQQGLYGAQEKAALEREAQYAQQLSATGAHAGAQAGERTQRLGIDLQRDVQENQLALQRYAEELKKYGIDVGAGLEKYGIDVGANTAANNALMDFYSRLMGGMFGMFSGGNMSSSSTTYYG